MMKEYRQRKLLRLKGHDYSLNNLYFITVCVNNRHHLFGEIDPKYNVGVTLCGRPHNPDKMIEKWLLEIENKFPFANIESYIVMPDHIHFILHCEDKTGDHTGSPLHSVIGWFKTMTTNEYIKGVKSGIYEPFDKRLWQRGYFDHIIRNDSDLINIREYIENNVCAWYDEVAEGIRKNYIN